MNAQVPPDTPTKKGGFMNGKTPSVVAGGASGAITVAMLWMVLDRDTQAIDSAGNQAAIAIKVAEQHGDEMNQLRGQLDGLRSELLLRTGNRYTSADAARDLATFERRMQLVEKECGVE